MNFNHELSFLWYLLLCLLGFVVCEYPFVPNYNQNPIDTSGPCQDARYRDKCYYFGGSVEWWIGAQEQCRRIGYKLVQIRNADEANFLAHHLRNGGARYYWVDASDATNEGLWLNSEQKPAFVGIWNFQEPNGQQWENCAELIIFDNGNGRMNDKYCTEWRKYICERRIDTLCPRGGYQDRCFWFSQHPSNWYQAKEHCQSLGMRLARIGGAEATGFIAQHQTDVSWVDIRFGGSMISGWNGAATNWQFNSAAFAASAATSAKCGQVHAISYTEGRIEGVDCMMLRHFVCERLPLSASSVAGDADQADGLPSSAGSAISSVVARRRRDAVHPALYHNWLSRSRRNANSTSST